MQMPMSSRALNAKYEAYVENNRAENEFGES